MANQSADPEELALRDRIVTFRKARGWSQEDLAREMGVSAGSIRNYEQAIRTPSAITAARLARTLGVTCDQLIADLLPATKAKEKPAGKAKGKKGRKATG